MSHVHPSQSQGQGQGQGHGHHRRPQGGAGRQTPPPQTSASNVLGSDISRRNPQDEYELLQRIGSGTYGDVYKVRTVLIKGSKQPQEDMYVYEIALKTFLALCTFPSLFRGVCMIFWPCRTRTGCLASNGFVVHKDAHLDYNVE